MYLLDTDTLIYSLKGHKVIKKQLFLHRNDVLKISIITLMELYYGAYKSQQVSANLAKVRRIETSFEAIPVKQEAVEVFARTKAHLELRGNRLDDFDLMIAACAMSHNLTLISNNTKHFQRIEGLKLDNWCVE
ncbi:MAG TPA: type II toxin-antitoxin system VapC family toxin [Thiothrix sp.]|nr:type II toxin-antitoxin system VapC family toxin [Thiothrix sp.]